MLVALTGIGLSAAAGLNAAIPLLVVALLARFTPVLTLPAQFAWLTSTWALVGLGALLAVDVVLDKIPAVDSLNDAMQTVLRPAAGGVAFAATAAAQDLQDSSWVRQNGWVTVVAGVLVALLVHAGKATARPVVNVSTGGLGAPVLSTAEDGFALTLSLVAVLLPLLVLVLLAALAWGFVLLRRRRVRARRAG